VKVPNPLSLAFDSAFEHRLGLFATQEGLIPSPEELRSPRFLARSIVPHVRRLSELFNRVLETEPSDSPPEAGAMGKRSEKSRAELEKRHREGLDPYWKESSNPNNFRLAYFLYFMPANLYRVAAIWAELSRLGFRWSRDTLRAIELGAGPASGACGIATGERFAPIGLPTGDRASWALLERDRPMLGLGTRWATETFGELGWGVRPFHRTLDLREPLLPAQAPRFDLWVLSYFLNESPLGAKEIARALLRTWERHLEEEGIVIIVEPALRLQSRRLLELRRELLAAGPSWLKVLLPCLGQQACGALAAETDWCHEEVSWWRPPYIKTIDRLAGLDRRTLPFSYLVLARSDRSREELLPALAGQSAQARYRLVSPAHAEGRELEFFVCGQEGKRRVRYRGSEQPGRGDILMGAELRGDANASRVDSLHEVL
jgi:hypothetical protein